MPALPASLPSNIVNLKLSLLDQSGLNFATFYCIELCFLIGIVSCNPVECITLSESEVKGCGALQAVSLFSLLGLGFDLCFYASLESFFRVKGIVVVSLWCKHAKKLGHWKSFYMKERFGLTCQTLQFAMEAKHRGFCSYSFSGRKYTFWLWHA